MAKFGLTEDELIDLEKCLLAAVEGHCIPDWEFEALLGCTRSEATELFTLGLCTDVHDERLLDQLVMLLSALSGSAQLSVRGRSVARARPEPASAAARRRVDLPLLHGLLDKLMGVATAAPQLRSRAEEPRAVPRRPARPPELESSVKVRVPRPLLSKQRAAKKRPG